MSVLLSEVTASQATGSLTLTGSQIVVGLLALVGVIGSLFGLLVKAWADRVVTYKDVIPVALALSDGNTALRDLLSKMEAERALARPLADDLKDLVAAYQRGFASLQELESKITIALGVAERTQRGGPPS